MRKARLEVARHLKDAPRRVARDFRARTRMNGDSKIGVA
jgi:hypothetical protein